LKADYSVNRHRAPPTYGWFATVHLPETREVSSFVVRIALVLAMTKGIGANLTNDQKKAHLADLRREHLIDQVCAQEILPPER